jgi:chemotaxis protein CheY-P-specific phosphatase CheC
MSATRAPIPPAEQQRLRELASLGARRAARSLAEFAGAVVRAGPPREIEAAKLPPFDTGVIFSVGGWLSGHLALFVDALSRRSLVRLLLDEEEVEAPPDMVASALCEVANIVVSQTVSAIADARGSLISLSVPELALEAASTQFSAARAARGEQAGALAFASELSAPDLELRILLVVAPDV